MGKKSFFVADFYCHKFKIIIEIDGNIHEERIEYDQERTAILNSMSFQVFRFNNNEVINYWDEVENNLKSMFLLK